MNAPHTPTLSENIVFGSAIALLILWLTLELGGWL
jgi:hypothetical protein